MTYCRQCRLGTLDGDGLCRLCGAAQSPPTRAERVAEGAGTVLAFVLHPASILVIALAALAAGARWVATSPDRFGNPPVFALFQGPARAASGDVNGALQGLAGIALAQIILVLLILIALWLLARRRNGARDRDSLAPQH